MVPARTFETEVTGEYDLRTANEYFGGWVGAPAGEELAVPMVFPVEGWKTSAAVIVRQPAQGRVTGEVFGAGRESEKAWRQALAVLSIDSDGSGFLDVGGCDPVIGALQKAYAGLRPVLFHSPYEAACAFVIGHRISIVQGRAIRLRMAEVLGAAVDTPLGELRAFPAPGVLLELDTWPGLAPAKVERLHGVARAAEQGLLDRERLRALPASSALAEVQSIPGIGPFFAQGILMRGAGTRDELADDDVTKQAVRAAYKLRQLPAQARVAEIAEAWRPYRTWATVLLHVWFRREAGGPVRSQRRGRG